ncbi:MAG: DUF1015 domain-containing protein, partial [Clostridiales Family XIII bacterium]|nr:DUF1015 domain-containing protein [Clostridiales Family XIII bacterium]
MAKVKSFKALRPARGYGDKVAALPYDVMTSDEAREAVKGNPYSFLHIDKAEIDLPVGVGLYDPAVYAKAKENLGRMTAEGIFVQDDVPGYYIYRLTMGGRTQTGVVGCVSIDDYLNGAVKRHELMLVGKETDRIRHVDELNAHTGPIFLTCRPDDGLTGVISRVAATGGPDCDSTAGDGTGHAGGKTNGAAASGEPLYDFTADDGVSHTIWKVDGAAAEEISGIFAGIPSLYIADGHHRCSAAIKVGEMRRAANPGYTGDEEYNYFLSAIFPADQLRIMDYNRVVSGLNGMSTDGFLSALREKFTVEACNGGGDPKPKKRHTFGLYVDGRWYALAAKPGTWNDDDPVSRLDVSILQNNVLAPLLGIEDPRSDDRIDFVGGIRGLAELERR